MLNKFLVASDCDENFDNKLNKINYEMHVTCPFFDYQNNVGICIVFNSQL